MKKSEWVMPLCDVKTILLQGVKVLAGKQQISGGGHSADAVLQHCQNTCRNEMFEAKVLLEEVMGCKYSEAAALGKEVTPLQAERFFSLIARRKKGELLQYLVGKWDFYNETYFVGPGVLIPRPDTEILVEQALQKIGLCDSENTVQMLDLCAGSGCVAISVQKNSNHPNLEVTAVEKSEKAFSYLLKNIAANGATVHPLLGDLTEVLTEFREGQFDFITANPPYIAKGEMAQYPELRSEPVEALVAGNEGLFFYQFIAKRYQEKLKPGGWMLFEIGYCQSAAVAAILGENGFCDIGVVRDYGQNDRVLLGRKKENTP